jgi:hypothetical protein
MVAHIPSSPRVGLFRTTACFGEFGRTPMSELRRPEDADNAGRDHHPNGFSIWLAGAGIKGGQVIGKTDDLGLIGRCATDVSSRICLPKGVARFGGRIFLR